MGVSYKKLWKLIIDKDMSRADIRKAAGVSASTFSKMNKNEYVALDVLVKLCITLDCELSDIVEIMHED